MLQRPFYGVLVFLTLASLLLAACGLEGVTPTTMPTPQPTRPSQATPSPTSGSSAGSAVGQSPLSSFAYVPVRVDAKPSLAAYGFAADKVSNQALLRELSDEQKALLTSSGFVVVPAGAAQIYEIYQQGKDRNVPLFITTDSVLHAYHILYDYVLRSVEFDNLIAAAKGLSASMLAAADGQYRAAQGPVKDSARVTLAFFTVAAKLLDASTPIPADVRSVVEKELALIEAHQGYADSPLFGYKEDYSQYAPRGHYTRNDQFKVFFKAMMWYGRIGFRLQPGKTAEEIALGREETRRALLIVSALEKSMVGQEAALKVWDRIYGPTAFFVGASDDLTVYDYQAVAASVYGRTPALQDLADTAKLDAFIAGAMKLPAPRIVSSYVSDQEDPATVTKAFRFMGQRFIPDSYVFQQLVYDKVGTRAQPRLFPKGLDVLAVFGSQRAYEILDTVYKETAYTNYKEQVTKLRAEFVALPQSDWTQNLYWGWLYSLLPLTAAKGQGYPSFMQTSAWTDKQLNTALGSWAELRHDTILYAKQSTTIKVTAIFPSEQDARGYVEPNPEVYARLAALAAQTRTGLESRGLLAGEYADKLAGFEKLLLGLKTIAEKELSDQPRSDDEYATIRNVGATLESLTTFSASEAGKLSSEADQRMAVVADVHTDSNSQQALEEGVGDAFPIYVLVPVEGTLTLAKGGVFSYYEFTVPLAQRLTDEKWQQMTPKPDRPAWTQSFIK